MGTHTMMSSVTTSRWKKLVPHLITTQSAPPRSGWWDRIPSWIPTVLITAVFSCLTAWTNYLSVQISRQKNTSDQALEETRFQYDLVKELLNTKTENRQVYLALLNTYRREPLYTEVLRALAKDPNDKLKQDAAERLSSLSNVRIRDQTNKIIKDQVQPKLDTIAAHANTEDLIDQANHGDSKAFDKLVGLKNDPGLSVDQRKTIDLTIVSVETDPQYSNSGQGCPYEFMGISVADINSKLNSEKRGDRQIAMGCLAQLTGNDTLHDFKSNNKLVHVTPISKEAAYPSLDILFGLMTDSPDLRVRARAFYTFQTLVSLDKPTAGSSLKVLDNETNTNWWHGHRSDYIH